jgi:hypothetical protein
MLIKQMVENWLPNDIYWPTVFLDNMPNFQIGELEVVRYNIHVLRDNLSRMRTTDKIDARWRMPLRPFPMIPINGGSLRRRANGRMPMTIWKCTTRTYCPEVSHFYPRGDNLIELVDDYASLMGGVNTRLINAPQRSGTVLPVDAGDKGMERKGSHLVPSIFHGATLMTISIMPRGGLRPLRVFQGHQDRFQAGAGRKSAMVLVDKSLKIWSGATLSPGLCLTDQRKAFSPTIP